MIGRYAQRLKMLPRIGINLIECTEAKLTGGYGLKASNHFRAPPPAEFQQTGAIVGYRPTARTDKWYRQRLQKIISGAVCRAKHLTRHKGYRPITTKINR